VGEHFDAMDTRFDGMDTHITRLEDDMSFIRRCFVPRPILSYVSYVLCPQFYGYFLALYFGF